MKIFLLSVGNIFFGKPISGIHYFSRSSSLLKQIPFKIILTFLAVAGFVNIYAQQNNQAVDAGYKKVVTERAAKIVNSLGLTDSAIYKKVLADIANQYIQLNKVHEANDNSIAEVKKLQASDAKTAIIKQLEEKKEQELLQLHKDFIALLKGSLTDDQLEKVKDGMTYGVFPKTYAAYLEMLTSLTKEQKDKIFEWLKEARELAMVQGSSDDKHKVFGKYKGKINNYLSAAGYDMKKEGEDWQKRIKEKKS